LCAFSLFDAANTKRMPHQLRQVVLFVAPILVGALNLTHPVIRLPVYGEILHHLGWWTTLHILNLAGFPLVGLAAYLLKNVHNTAATVSKAAIAVFVPVYEAFDALAGIGTGTLVQQVSLLSPDKAVVFEPTIDAFWKSPTIYAIAAVGSIGWIIAMLAAAIAFTQPERRRLVAVIAVMIFFVGGWARSTFVSPDGSNIGFGWWLVVLGMRLAMLIAGAPHVTAGLLTFAAAFFGASHVTPTGPLGMACFLGAAVYVELAVRKQNAPEQPAAV